MKNILLCIVLLVLSSCSSLQTKEKSILGLWVWKKSVPIDNAKKNESTSRTTTNQKEIEFTKDKTIITYKNGIELRINNYELSKGISNIDQQEHDLITFEGITYVIEKMDSKNLTLVNNSLKGYRSYFER